MELGICSDMGIKLLSAYAIGSGGPELSRDRMMLLGEKKQDMGLDENNCLNVFAYNRNNEMRTSIGRPER